jgi:hypothetical protein
MKHAQMKEVMVVVSIHPTHWRKLLELATQSAVVTGTSDSVKVSRYASEVLEAHAVERANLRG